MSLATDANMQPICARKTHKERKERDFGMQLISANLSRLATLLFLSGVLPAVAEEAAEALPAGKATIVCSSEDARPLVDDLPIIVLQLEKTPEGWRVSGDFEGADVMVKDQKRFTVVGVNYLITVYRHRGAFVALDQSIPLICKEIATL